MRFKGISIFKPKRRSKRHHPWLIAITVDGKRHVTSGSTDRGDTEEIASRLSRLAQRIEHSLADPVEIRREMQRRKPLTHHLNAYERNLKSCGMTAKHSLQMRLYAEQHLEQFATVDAIVSSDVQDEICALKVGAVTKNRRMYAVQNFLRWGADDNRWPREIVERIRLTRLSQSKIRPRRVIEVSELVALIEAAEAGSVVAGVSGKQRALMYRTLVSTGLRLGELTRLCVKHIDDQGFDIPASLTKNRKAAFVALPANLMIEVQDLTKGKRADDRIFPVSKFNPDRLLKHDLVAAGIPHQTNRGVFDFHSLRHMCATLLIASGAQVKAVQSHMRHGSSKLTLDTYGHLFDRDRFRASQLLGEIVQRRVQRTGDNMANKTLIPAWSDGESNPDLLNAIHPSEALILIARNELRNKRGKGLARGAPARLLGKLYKRSISRRRKGSNR